MKTVISTIGKMTNYQSGFTYVMALIAVALISIASGLAYSSTRHIAHKAQEEELIFRGMAYYHAIESYYQAKSPHQYPKRLDDLLRDPRFLYKRHIRKRYAQPNGEPWSLLKNSNGRIVGVFFDSERQPIKQAGFGKPFLHFNSAKNYRQWLFTPLQLTDKQN